MNMNPLLKRLLAIPALAFAVATSARATATDLWWNANESGWGVNVVQQADILFLTFFVYGPSGQPLWLASALAKLQNAAQQIPNQHAERQPRPQQREAREQVAEEERQRDGQGDPSDVIGLHLRTRNEPASTCCHRARAVRMGPMACRRRRWHRLRPIRGP